MRRFLGFGAALALSLFVGRVAAPTLAVAVLLHSQPAHAYDKGIGTLTSTGTSVNQETTAVPFALPGCEPLLIQCDAAACVNVGKGTPTIASCAVGNLNRSATIAQGQIYPIPMVCSGTTAVDHIAVISVSGTVNCDVRQQILP